LPPIAHRWPPVAPTKRAVVRADFEASKMPDRRAFDLIKQRLPDKPARTVELIMS
jgi:hypothetical protein